MPTSYEPRDSRRSVTLAGGLALALMLSHSPARAAVSEADADSAKKLYAEGARLEATDLPAARDRFKAAFKLRPSPILGIKLGAVHERLGELLEARQVYRRSQSVKPDEFLDVGVKEESQNARDARAEAGRKADALERRIPSLTFRLENTPKGAQPKVSIDETDVPVEALAVPRSVNPGKHVVVVKLEGQAPKRSAFELAEGQTRVVTVDLTPDPIAEAPKPPAPGSAVDAPPPPVPAPGRADGGPNASGPGTMTWVGLGVGGAGLVSIGLGALVGFAAKGKYADSAPHCPNELCDAEGAKLAGDARGLGTTSKIFLGVGAVAAIAGVTLYLAAPSSKPSAPQVTLGAGSVGFKVGF